MTQPDTTDRIVRASASVALGTTLSRLTGLARVVALVYAIGRGTLADSFNLANTTPNIVYELLLGGVLTATLVPLFVTSLERHDERGPGVIVGTAAVALAALSALAFAAAPWVARLYAIDAPAAERDAQLEVMTFLIRCFSPQIFFYGLTALAGALLNAHRRFAAAAYAPVLNNVVVVCVLLAFARAADGPQEGWRGVERIRGDDGLLLLLGLGTTAGVAATALVLVPALARAGVRVRPAVDWRHAAVRRLVRLSGWTVGYVVCNQLALLFVLVLAASGDDGDVSAYQYAFVFFQLPHGLFAVSITTTTTPELARRAATGDVEGLRRDFNAGLRLLLLAVVPAATALAVLAQPLVGVLVRGAFGPADAAATADTLQALALGLPAFSVYLYTLRAFYARQDTRTPFVVNAFENLANVVFAAALFPGLGVQGLAFAYALAYTIGAVTALLVLRRRVAGVPDRATAATAVQVASGAAALAIVAAPLASAIGRHDALDAALACAVAGLAGGLAFVAVLRVLGSPELARLARLATRRRAASPDV